MGRKRIVLGLWGSATRTGGGPSADLAFAAAIGCRPTRTWPRLALSDFRAAAGHAAGPACEFFHDVAYFWPVPDVFPSQMALFAAAVRGVGALADAEAPSTLAGLERESLSRQFRGGARRLWRGAL